MSIEPIEPSMERSQLVAEWPREKDGKGFFVKLQLKTTNPFRAAGEVTFKSDMPSGEPSTKWKLGFRQVVTRHIEWALHRGATLDEGSVLVTWDRLPAFKPNLYADYETPQSSELQFFMSEDRTKKVPSGR